jgi:hypothetical protein
MENSHIRRNEGMPRLRGALTRMYTTQNFWTCGLRPSSGFITTRKHNIPKIGSISVFKGGEGDACSLGSLDKWLRLALSKETNRVGASLPLLEDGNRVSFRNVVFSICLELRTMNKVQKTCESKKKRRSIWVSAIRMVWQQLPCVCNLK